MEFSFFKGLAFVGFLGSLIVAYFQYLSTYQNKVDTLAKEDLAAATSAFGDASSALSAPLALQERLIFGFYDAVKHGADSDNGAYVTKTARDIGKDYETNYMALRENINLIAQRMEIYLDWASDINRDPAVNIPPLTDPISISTLGEYEFDCDRNPPSFGNGTSTLKLNKDGQTLNVDWFSAKHNVLTIYYCFKTTHDLMEPVRQWSSSSPIDSAERKDFLVREADIKARLDKQVLRLNAFMNVALNEIEQIRVKYRPNGFVCNLPIVREAIGMFSRKCTPIRTSVG
jgi:hypothetical protein